jgi:phosphohistidine phosphatase
MQLVIVRHADAGHNVEFAHTGKPDHLRPLSIKGETQMRAAALGLRRLAPTYDVIATSPYTRAVQTAELIAHAYDGRDPITTTVLEPERAPEEFVSWVRTHGDASVVIAVGHEPHLTKLAMWLRASTDESPIEFKKGGACLLEFEARVEKGAGRLRWLMGPKELAQQADRHRS